jgi:hypothetical protein
MVTGHSTPCCIEIFGPFNITIHQCSQPPPCIKKEKITLSFSDPSLSNSPKSSKSSQSWPSDRFWRRTAQSLDVNGETSKALHQPGLYVQLQDLTTENKLSFRLLLFAHQLTASLRELFDSQVHEALGFASKAWYQILHGPSASPSQNRSLVRPHHPTKNPVQ